MWRIAPVGADRPAVRRYRDGSAVLETEWRTDTGTARVIDFMPPRTERPEVEPLTGDLARLHVTVSKTFLQKLDCARDALSHSNPGASIAAQAARATR